MRFWNNQRRVSSRILQRWWRQTAELLKEDLEEAAMKKDKAMIRKYYDNIRKIKKRKFYRKDFIEMCLHIWKNQYTMLNFTEEEVDDIMLELTGDTEASTEIGIDSIIEWRINTQYGGREY